ncbi:MAG: hypothetical protein OXQ84_20335 [bacterium]|nr:hypothetical protein [bacterium]
MPDKSLVQVVGVGLGDAFAFALQSRWDVGQFPGATAEDGAVSRAHGPARILA